MAQWQIQFTRRAAKQIKKLDNRITTILWLLIQDLMIHGPAPGKNWSNYGKLKGKGINELRHCHLTKGNPAYVCCWKVIDKKLQIMEVYYAGSHEKAPY